MHSYIQIILGGVFTGSLYGLAGMGLQLILGTTKKVHLAYGHIWVLSALLVSSILYNFKIPVIVMLPLMTILCSLFGWVIHPKILWRNKKLTDTPRSFLLMSLGLALILEDIGTHIWALPVSAVIHAPKSINLGAVMIPPIKSAIFFAALVVACCLSLFLKYNIYGNALRAWHGAEDDIVLVGVDPSKLGKMSVTIGIGIAGLAGAFLALSYSAAIIEGLDMTVRSLCLAVIAGTLTPWRVLGLGVLLGIGESWISLLLGAQWAPVLSYSLLLTMVSFR
ncbi:branched-chain amino acid ABC transporter permease [Thermodesulfobacteriota bacterium]